MMWSDAGCEHFNSQHNKSSSPKKSPTFQTLGVGISGK